MFTKNLFVIDREYTIGEKTVRMRVEATSAAEALELWRAVAPIYPVEPATGNTQKDEPEAIYVAH